MTRVLIYAMQFWVKGYDDDDNVEPLNLLKIGRSICGGGDRMLAHAKFLRDKSCWLCDVVRIRGVWVPERYAEQAERYAIERAQNLVKAGYMSRARKPLREWFVSYRRMRLFSQIIVGELYDELVENSLHPKTVNELASLKNKLAEIPIKPYWSWSEE
jgi:hypothetical protein